MISLNAPRFELGRVVATPAALELLERLGEDVLHYVSKHATDNSDDSGGDPLDDHYGIDDLAPETIQSIIEDCQSFQNKHFEDIKNDLERAGHDFWLTRNGHGAGFWDGDWDDEIGRRLTEASDAYGCFDLYIGDDGFIYS